MGKLSDFPLQDYVSKGYKTLVETGSGTGTGINTARSFAFRNIWSCEIVEEQAKILGARYADDLRIRIINRHSPEFLDYILEHVIGPEEKCVFWLDSHYPAADIYGTPYDAEPDLLKRLPLEGELEVLQRHKRFHDIIICDDLRIYEKCPMQGGDLEACGLGHITRYNAPDFLAPWRETHDIQKIYQDTGYIFMTPKS